MKSAALVGWALAMVSSACAHRAAGPAATVVAFGEAVARGDLRAAYALTSAGFQRRTPFEAFAAGFEAAGADRATVGNRMVADGLKLAPRTEIELSLGERVPLVMEAGGWRIDGPVAEAWGQSTPRAALRTFVRAIDAGRFDVLLRLVPSRYRGGLSAAALRDFWQGAEKDQHRALLDRVRAAIEAPIVESAGEARLLLPPDRQVRLVREEGGWKVDDPDEPCQLTPGDSCGF